MKSAEPDFIDTPPRRWLVRFVFTALVAGAVSIVWYTNHFLTERFTESTRNRAEVRMALYIGNLRSELQRASIVPLLLSRDPSLIGALNSQDYSQSTQRLISYRDEIGAASLMLLDRDARTVAATDRALLGSLHRNAAFYVEALRSNDTVFSTVRTESGGFTFSYSRKIMVGNELSGVIVVGVDLAKFESSWAGFSDAVFVTDSEGMIILVEPRKRRCRCAARPMRSNGRCRPPPTGRPCQPMPICWARR